MTEKQTTELPLSFRELPVSSLELPGDLWSERISLGNTASGLQLPPTVCRTESGWQVLDGCKRVGQAAEGRLERLLCGIIDRPLDPKEAGLLRIRLNCGRTLQFREKHLFIAWMKSNLKPEEYAAEVEKLPLLPGERHDLEQLLSCTPWLLDAALDGKLDPTVAPEMNHLPQESTAAIIALFSILSPSRQMQRELAEWLPELAFNRKITVQQLLGSTEFSTIINDARLNAPQKAARFHDAVHAERFPLYSKMKESWSAAGRKINPDPARVSFLPSPYFEKNRLEIRIKAENGALLQRTLGKLAEVDKVGGIGSSIRQKT